MTFFIFSNTVFTEIPLPVEREERLLRLWCVQIIPLSKYPQMIYTVPKLYLFRFGNFKWEERIFDSQPFLFLFRTSRNRMFRNIFCLSFFIRSDILEPESL